MPYRKYKKTYKKNNRKPSYYRHGMNALTLASNALTVANQVKKMINVEYKFLDTSETLMQIGSGANIFQISNIPQGDTESSRDGSQVKVVRINIRGTVRMNDSVPSTNVRVMLICDKQTNSAIYLHGDLLQNTAVDLNIVSPLNLDNKYRFHVLYDKNFLYSNNGKFNSQFNINKNIQTRMRFDGATADIANITSSSYSLVVFSDENAPAGQPFLTFTARIRFVDN